MEKGYHNTTTRDLAKAAGLSIGGLYYYIKSKDELLQITYERVFEIVQPMIALSSKNYPSDVLLRKQIYTWCQIIDKFRHFTTFAYREFPNLSPEYQSKITFESEMVATAFKQTLDKGIKEGKFKKVNTGALSLLLYVLGHEWSLGGRSIHDVISLKEYSELITKVVLEGIGKKQSSRKP